MLSLRAFGAGAFRKGKLIMDPKGYEKKPWFPYVKNMYNQIEEDIMSVDAKGYEEKPWWPYVLDLQKKIEEGGGGGGDFSSATVTCDFTLPGATGWTEMPGASFANTTINIEDVSALEQGVRSDINPTTHTFKVILYKGKCVFYGVEVSGKMAQGLPKTYVLPEDDSQIETSGAIELDGYGYIITGDCALKAVLVQGS